MVPSVSVIVTLSISLTSVCWLASRSIVTTGVVEVAVRTVPDAAAPSDAFTVVTRIADGSNTARPGASVPVTARPRYACSCSSA